MTTHALIYRNGKLWFTQHHTGHPDFTGKLLLAVTKKFGKITPELVKRYFDPCHQDSGEYEYDIRDDGIYYRTSPGTITIQFKNNALRRASKSQEDKEKVWRKLTVKATGSLKDLEQFLQENIHLALTKDDPKAEKDMGIPPSKYLIGTKIFLNSSKTATGKITRKHFDIGSWHYDVGDLCFNEEFIECA